MSNYFQGKFCIVDLRTIQAFVQPKLVGLPYLPTVVLANGRDFTLEGEDVLPFLEAYRRWIERPKRRAYRAHKMPYDDEPEDEGGLSN